jgi:hypothetical protein
MSLLHDCFALPIHINIKVYHLYTYIVYLGSNFMVTKYT